MIILSDTIAPHGGELINRIPGEEQRKELLEKAASLNSIVLNNKEISDLLLIAIGGFSPLKGFMKKADYDSVVDRMHLADGLPWTIPITLSADDDKAASIKEGDEIALLDPDGTVRGIMTVDEKYKYDKKKEAVNVYRTDDEAHPGVSMLYSQGETLLGGDIVMLNRPEPPEFPQYWRDPAETRKIFADRGWKRIVAFQTRNPVHRAHEYLQKAAMEICDGLLLHPLVGETKKGDIPADVRMKCYEVLLENYYPEDRVLLSVLPAAMRYAGPAEAIFHSIMRKNYGCTHFIVGRDHAGVGNYYGTYDAHLIFEQFDPQAIGITPLFFDHAFFCKKCGGMASTKTCPHGKEDHVFLSGTKVREMLSAGEVPPPEFTRPEVAEVLIDSMKHA
ncbi:MAG TPA: sulfate adenylyltransferase [bacterium]|nr:sulfate adenylyltransferase [bacterium]